jgi:hypothetical protein
LRDPLPADADVRWPWRAWAWPLLARCMLFIIVALIGMVVLGDVSKFKERWLLPLVAWVPLLLFVWRPQLQDPSNRRGGIYTGAVLLFALVFFVMATARPWAAGAKAKPGEADELTFPVPELAAQLRQAGYDGMGHIVGADHMLAAMLRSEFPTVNARACDATPVRIPAGCVTAALAEARTQSKGVLLVSRARPQDAEWWQVVLPQTGRLDNENLAIHSSKMPSQAPPMGFHFLWLPPQSVPGGAP